MPPSHADIHTPSPSSLSPLTFNLSVFRTYTTFKDDRTLNLLYKASQIPFPFNPQAILIKSPTGVQSNSIQMIDVGYGICPKA